MKGQFNVTYSCGHMGTIEFNGSAAQLRRAISACEHQVCDACANAKRAEKDAKAAAANKECGLPDLTGTEKQIAWAESLRQEAIEIVDEMISRYNMDDPKDAAWAEAIENARPQFFNQTDATWWIDNRGRYTRVFNALIRQSLPKKEL